MRELLRRLHYLLRQQEQERELDEEMRCHLEMRAEDLGSMDAARRRFGNLTRIQEDSRSMWIGMLCDQLLQDVRYGLRTMAASPLFTSMAVLTLALGVGANTAIFSFMDAILLRTLPVPRPKQLVTLQWNAREMPGVIRGLAGSRFYDPASGFSSPNFPFPAFENLRSEPGVLSALFAYASASRINVQVGEEAEYADGLMVSGNFHSALDVRAALGRLITDDDDRAGAAPVAVLSHSYWERRFGARRSAIGKAIRVNNTLFTVVGVTAPGFFGLDPGTDIKFYVPLRSAPLLSQDPVEDERRRFFNRNFYWVELMGRLRPGAGREEAQAALAGQFRQYAVSTAAGPEEQKTLPMLTLEDGAAGLQSLRRQYSKPLWLLMGMVGLILAVACANVAGLLLARATARRREIALRSGLGASRSRVFRQLLTESVLLSLAGGALGLLVAWWGIRSITWLLANGSDESTLHAELNWPVLGFAFGVAMLTGILFGLAPALQATRPDVLGGLKESKAGGARRGGGPLGGIRLLLAGQIAVSLLLVVASGLFLRTVSNLYAKELGFNADNVLVFSLNARQAGYEDAALARFYEDILGRLRRIPGVRSAGAAQMTLVSGHWSAWDLTIPGVARPANNSTPGTCVITVDPEFLNVMRIPVLLGRGIEERDLRSPRVAVINEVFAKQFFAGDNPIGRRIGLNSKDRAADIEIVGVARTALYNSVKETDTPPVVYVPITQDLRRLRQLFVHLRTNGDPLGLAQTVRRIVQDVSPRVPIADMRTQRQQIDRTISQERTFASLCSAFGVLALVIAFVGLYGAMAYNVARRTSEIGIRMALGAARRRVVWMVLREGMAVACAGLMIGAAMTWASARLVESYLFGVTKHDPLVLTVSALLLAGATAAVASVPAWRASRIDPLNALRHE